MQHGSIAGEPRTVARAFHLVVSRLVPSAMLPPFDQKLVVKIVNPAAAEVSVAYPTIWCASARSRC
jgi:hypothetical protein